MGNKVKNTIGKTCKALACLPVIGPLFEPKPKVAVLRLSGVIGDLGMRRQALSHARTEKLIEQAFDVYNLQAVALAINSPGGSAAQSELIAGHIRRLAAEKEIPVLAFAEDVAASGGYWLACAADEIFAQETSIIGSVGVISAGFGFEDFIDRYGIKRRIHTAGKDKSFLDPFVPEKPGDVKRLKTIQNDIHGAFKDWVRLRRGEALKAADKDIFEGQFWTADTALTYGLIDGIGDLRTICRERFGENIRFVDLSPEKKWLPGFLGAKNQAPDNLPEQVLDMIEDRALWARYGL